MIPPLNDDEPPEATHRRSKRSAAHQKGTAKEDLADEQVPGAQRLPDEQQERRASGGTAWATPDVADA